MEDSDIRNYAQLMKELGLTGLELTDGDKKVRLERFVAPQTAAAAAPAAPVQTAAQGAEEASVSGETTVTSDIIGVFYAAPSASAAPFVREGDHVKKGQTLCIVEAMKLMNEVEAPCDGVITKVFVSDGQTVEFGTKLFTIKEG